MEFPMVLLMEMLWVQNWWGIRMAFQLELKKVKMLMDDLLVRSMET